jgi:HemY protein
MKAVLLFVLTLLMLVLGILAANFLLQDNGYVLINFRGYAIEMSVPALLLLLLATYLAIRLLVRLWRAPRQLGAIAARRRSRKASERMVRGYIELAEGNFARGEKLLTQGVRDSDTPLLNYLAAARAAQSQGDSNRRDNWLKLAYEEEPTATAAVLLTQAELQIAGNEADAARITLAELLERAPRNSEALRLKAELDLAGGDWNELETLLPQLAKYGQVPKAKLDNWYERTWCALLGDSNAVGDRVQSLWKSLPKHLRGNPRLVCAHANARIREGRFETAESIVRKELDRQWSEELILLYGEIKADDRSAMLRQVERWLRDRPNDPALLLTAGRLCVSNQLWGKARSYFESSIAARSSPGSWNELGHLLMQLGEAPAASDAFQQGLRLISNGTVDVPRIAAQIPDQQ